LITLVQVLAYNRSLIRILFKNNIKSILRTVLTAGLLFNTLRTGDADLRFYITTVQDG